MKDKKKIEEKDYNDQQVSVWLNTLKKNALDLKVFSSIKYVPVIKPTVCSTNKAQYKHLSIFYTMYSYFLMFPSVFAYLSHNVKIDH